MREIKFRVWDEIERRYVYPVFDITNAFPNDRSYLYQQYTGKQDRNGKEIYEGDVVRHYFDGIDTGDISEIAFKDSAFRGKAINRYAWTSEMPLECEIIGNLHEHPELIKTETA